MSLCPGCHRHKDPSEHATFTNQSPAADHLLPSGIDEAKPPLFNGEYGRISNSANF
jgi:hypothetical protein